MLALLGVALSAPYTEHECSCRVLGGEPEDFKRYHHVRSGDECLAQCNANAACTAYEYANVLQNKDCLLYTSPSPRDRTRSRMPSSA